MHYSGKMEFGKKKIDLAEVFMCFKDLEVTGDLDSESDIEINHQDYKKIFIQPPVDANGNTSDIDSADEKESGVNNLSGNQLLVPAILELKEAVKGGRVPVGQLSNNNTSVKSKTASDVLASSSTRIKKQKLNNTDNMMLLRKNNPREKK